MEGTAKGGHGWMGLMHFKDISVGQIPEGPEICYKQKLSPLINKEPDCSRNNQLNLWLFRIKSDRRPFGNLSKIWSLTCSLSEDNYIDQSCSGMRTKGRLC